MLLTGIAVLLLGGLALAVGALRILPCPNCEDGRLWIHFDAVRSDKFYTCPRCDGAAKITLLDRWQRGSTPIKQELH